MKAKLARILIERGVIQRGSMLEAYHNTKGISCQCDASVLASFRLIGAQATKEWVFFETIIPDTKERQRIRCDQIISLDGMPLDRIAESQQLTEDGEDAKLNSRRGRRKPEH
jgi:hypothetical protein